MPFFITLRRAGLGAAWVVGVGNGMPDRTAASRRPSASRVRNPSQSTTSTHATVTPMYPHLSRGHRRSEFSVGVY